jgi:methyltransferase (TIGR00027 family)
MNNDIKTNKRVKTKVSQTASFTCFYRACASVEKDARFKGPDYIAEKLVPFFPRVLFLKCKPLRRLMINTVAPQGIYEYVSARTMVLDQVFSNAIEEAFPQIVILGAGFDTRGLRFHDSNRGTRIYELDAPVTQQAKRLLFEEKGIAVPKEITFVPVDFDEESLDETLFRVGYRPDLKSLFLWEGVTMYLSAEAVDNTLAFIHSHAASGSILAFDYILASVLRRENTLYGEKGIYQRTLKSGEGWTFGIEEGEIASFLSKHGFEMIAHYTPRELQTKFLTVDNGTIYGRINETHCIAIAGVIHIKNIAGQALNRETAISSTEKQLNNF